jgi:hypothetical protein
VIEDEDKEALKVEHGSPMISKVVQKPLVEECDIESPSTYIRRTLWFTHTLRGVEEHVETPRSTFKERKPLKKFLNYMKLMKKILDSEPSSFQE